MHVFASPDDFKAAVGEDIGSSDWFHITQERVDTFADATEDRQWIHVDPDRAKDGPFGATIAHGYLTLSLLVPLMKGVFRVDGQRMGLNYGLNKVRFPAPVKVGSQVRAAVTVKSVEDVEGGVQVVWLVTVTAEGSTKPGCVAESITRYYY